MSFDQVLIKCGAPAFCGIKPASLFSINIEYYGNEFEKLSELSACFSGAGIFIVPIQKTEKRILLFVYNKKLLQQKCAKKEAVAYLKEKNYPVEKGFEAILLELISRLLMNGNFPHEVGFFLGYPLEDVVQFELNNGSGFKFCGDWKVYSNIESALVQMDEYATCRNYCSTQLEKGIDIPQAAENYKAYKNNLNLR